MAMLKKLSDVFLSSKYLLAMDSYHNVYLYEFTRSSECVPGKEFNLDKVIAHEVLPQSNFIELYPSKDKVWAVTSLRQVMCCTDLASFKFHYYNSIFSVKSACASPKH
jgi:hypothetical protein